MRVAGYYLFNLLLYIVPLAFAWSSRAGANEVVAMQSVGGSFFVLTVVTATSFHFALIVTGNSHGFFASLDTISTTMGVYLAAALGAAYPLILSMGQVGEFLRGMVMYRMIGSKIQEAEALDPTPIAAVLGAIGLVYFLYSVYLASRIHHGASRVAGLFASGVIFAIPTGFALAILADSTLSGYGFVGRQPAQALAVFIIGVVCLDIITPTTR